MLDAGARLAPDGKTWEYKTGSYIDGNGQKQGIWQTASELAKERGVSYTPGYEKNVYKTTYGKRGTGSAPIAAPHKNLINTKRLATKAAVAAGTYAATKAASYVVVKKRREYVKNLDPATRKALYKAVSKVDNTASVYSIVNTMYKVNQRVEDLPTSAQKSAYLNTVLKGLTG